MEPTAVGERDPFLAHLNGCRVRIRHVPNLDLPGAGLFYEQTGSGPDIVWNAAGDMPGSSWHAFQTPAFEDGFRQTTYDARGVGQTESRTPPPWPIPTYAEDAIALIEAVCEPPVIMIGLSMGSLITQEVCLQRPDLVRCGIVMGTCARKTGFIRDWEVAEIGFRRSGGRLSREFAVAHYGILMYPAEVLGDDELWERVKPYVDVDYGERDGEMLAAQWEACLEYDSLSRLPGCEVSLHVVSFSHDVQTPPARGRQVAEAAKRGAFHLLEGLGHASAFGHRPDVVNAKLREIVDSVVDD
jgi:pimeloyl-ACP methyl ester carboxylesterase